MTRSRSPRFLAALVGTLLALAAMAPAGVLAAPPNWSLTVTPIPGAVSPGSTAGYVVTVTNGGPSTISQLYLETVAGSPQPSYVSGSGCSAPAVDFFCNLGSLKKGKSVSVVVGFDTTGEPSPFSVTFEINTTGATPSDGGTSHGDVIQATGETELNANAQDFAGDFLNSLVVQNNQDVSDTNPQSTLVFAPALNIGVSVEDGPGASANPCPAALNCFSEISEIHVANGTSFPGGFKVYLQFDSSQIPPGVNKNNLSFWHEFDSPKTVGGVTVTGEVIDENCRYQGNSTTPRSFPCKEVFNLGGGDLGAFIWLTENGNIRGI
jgi:hypothetical protein